MLTWDRVILGVVLFIITFTVSIAVVSIIVVKLPADYFKPDRPRQTLPDHHRAIRYVAIVGKNILGLMLVALGIVMSLPGVPGQGILTILLGVMLVDFPGKRTLEHKLVSRPQVLKSINKLRKRFGKPELILD